MNDFHIQIFLFYKKKMQCPVCRHSYNSTRLPTIVSTGQTLCLYCNLENQNNSKPIINHSLLTLIRNNECSLHKLPLNFYCIEDHHSYCQKCILFPRNPHQNLKSKTIIRNQEFPLIVKGMFEQLDKISGQLKQQVNEVKNKKKLTIERLIQNVEQAYIQIVQELKIKKQNIKSKIITTVDNLITTQWEKLREEFQTLNQSLSSLKMTKGPKAIKKGMEIIKNYERVQKQLTDSSKKMIKDLESKSSWKWMKKNIQWSGYFEGFQEKDILCFDSFQKYVDQKMETENLLNMIDMSQGRGKKKQIEWVKVEEFQTENTEVASDQSFISMTSVNTKISESDKMNSKILSIENKSMIPKTIPNQVRTLKLTNLKLTNQEVKDLFERIKRSFISKLDLTGNKITNSFIVELKKINTGKYLKKIILTRNEIVPSEQSFRKKVQQLEKENLQILL